MAPLHMAVKDARIKVVEYLVDQQADVNLPDNSGVRFDTCDSSDYTFDLSYISSFSSKYYVHCSSVLLFER